MMALWVHQTPCPTNVPHALIPQNLTACFFSDYEYRSMLQKNIMKQANQLYQKVLLRIYFILC